MTIIIFGASGDLSKRMLFPSLSALDLKTHKIIGYSRSALTTDSLFSRLEPFGTYSIDFMKKVKYIQGQYYDLTELKRYADDDPICYFSVPPGIYLDLLDAIKKVFKSSRVVIEKPYVPTRNSLEPMNVWARENPTHRLLFIDHYLLKPVLFAIPKLKHEFGFFNQIINKTYVTSITMILTEKVGAEGRAFFLETGLIEDIMMNHVASMYSTLLADKNTSLSKLAAARADILKFSYIIDQNSIFGLYNEYEKEEQKPLNVETLAFLHLRSSEERYKNINMWFVGGKALDKKNVEIRVLIKDTKINEVLQVALDLNKNLKEVGENIKKLELVFSISNDRNIHFEVECQTGAKRKYVLIEEDKINEEYVKKYKMIGNEHTTIFNCLINDIEFPTCGMMEAFQEWRLFDKVELRKGKPLLRYNKGSTVPNEIVEMMRKADRRE